MGGVKVPCLVDTGSMVSCVSESFFRRYFEPWGQERLQSCHWLQLRAANGLAIPYIGYLELEVQLCGKLMPNCGVLIVKDPPGGVPAQVPGVLAMNIIRKCYQELFGQYGMALFSQSCVLGTPPLIVQALQQCQHVNAQTHQDSSGRAKVRGKRAWRIPGGVMKIVAATCAERYSGSTVLFEPPASGSLPSVVSEVPPCVATLSAQTVAPTVQQQVEDVDLSSLSTEEQLWVRSLLGQYVPIFSAYDGDLGCTNLISHDIPVADEIPVSQRYRRIPPSEYGVVKEHINQLLLSQAIRESSSPYASPIVLARKNDGSLRMCVDYRQLNSKTRKDAFHLPCIEESLDALSGACWFTPLDLASGYNQVPVTESDKPKTAFCTPFGLFEWNRMPFGLCNTPSTFQRLMQRIFGDKQ